ncbi:glycosyltransferase family 4 protein [Candidatus Woesearchaeota archaeon]|nr:glycosyltransferase family 4 protein [Candidatus Woesearchaeota archaeon]
MRVAVVGFHFNCPTGRRNLLVWQEIAKKYDINVDILTVDSWKESGFNDKNLLEYETERLRIHKLKAFFTSFGQYKYMMPGLVFKLLKLKPDIIYAAEEPVQAFITFPSCIVAKLAKKPFIFFTYENIYKKWLFPFSCIEKFVIKNTSTIIAATGEAKDVLVKKGANPAKIAVFPEAGTETDFFKPVKSSLNKKLGWKKEETVLFAGRLIPEKGIDIILGAREILKSRNKKYKYLFVGSGPLSEKLKEMSGDDIKVIDWLPLEELPQAYNSASVLLYPSKVTKKWKEQFGFSMVEALSCGIPVIASDVGGPREIVKHKKDGLLIPVGDAEELANSIQLIMENSALREKFGKFGRDDMVKRFSKKAIAEKLYETLEAYEKNGR